MPASSFFLGRADSQAASKDLTVVGQGELALTRARDAEAQVAMLKSLLVGRAQ